MKIVVNGAEKFSDVPGLEVVLPYAQVAYAPDEDHLASELPDAAVLLGWVFSRSGIVAAVAACAPLEVDSLVWGGS